MGLEKCKKFYERASKVIPGGAHTRARNLFWDPPLYISRGEGCRLWDVDGNEYIDYVLGYGPLIFGHTPDFIIEAIETEMKKGWLYVSEYELSIEVAEKICSIVPCAEQVIFDTDGAKACMYALRFARAYTGRDKIIKFEGQYHGLAHYEVILSINPPLTVAGTEAMPHPIPSFTGIPRNASENIIIQPWNNESILEKTIEDHAHEISALIMEPLPTFGTALMPKKGYLDFVRKITEKHDIVLIFDEVVTGFRIALGGAQEYFRIKPDLACYGKVLGHGLPLSAIAGKRDIMEIGGKIHGGTTPGNRICCAVAKATLDELAKNNGAVYQYLNKLGGELIKGLRDSASDAKINMLIQGVGPLFNILFTDADTIWSYREQLSHCDFNLLESFERELFKKGIYHQRGVRWCLSRAHQEDDIKKTIKKSYEALKSMKTNGKS